MKIIIVGSGDVGHYLCQILSRDGHSITLIESSGDIAEDVEEHLDVRVIRGNGASAKTLAAAGAQDCDCVLAMTASDQVNMVTCAIAHKIGAKRTIARVHDQVYADNSVLNIQKLFDIDVLVNPEALTAVELSKYVRNPERAAVEDFARGQIELQEVEIDENSKVAGKPLKEAHLSPDIRIGYVERGENLIVPDASTVLSAHDRITIIGAPETLVKYKPLFSNEEAKDNVRIVLNGATETALSIARRLHDSRFKVRIIEPDLAKCREIAESFPSVTVINGSATTLRLLEEEQVGSADFFIACTKDDEENVMTSLQAKKLGAKRVELVINKPDYEHVLQNISGFLDITAIASPRRVTATEVKKYLTDKNYNVLGSLRGGAIQFVELKAEAGAKGVGVKLSELGLPRGCIIAALVRNDIAHVPRAGDVVEDSDKLVIILDKKNVAEVVALFVK